MDVDKVQLCSDRFGESSAVVAMVLFLIVFAITIRKEERRELLANWIAMRDPFGVRFWLGNVPLIIAFVCLLMFFLVAGYLSETYCNK